MKRSNRFGNPGTRRRMALGVIAGAALVAGTGAALRGGDADRNWTYLLDATGWLLAVTGAVIEARAGALFLDFAPGPARRRAILLAVAGIAAALAGCVAASMAVDDDTAALARGVAYGALVGGVGTGFAGLFTLGWYFGGDYAARRIERMGEEEW